MMEKSLEKKQNKWNIIILAAATLLVLFMVLKDNFGIIVEQIVKCNKIWLLVALAFFMGYCVLKAYIIMDLTRSFNKKYTFFRSLSLQMMTNFFNAVTPFATGGEPFLIYMISKDKIHISDATNIVNQNLFVHQISIVGFGLTGIIMNRVFKFLPDFKLFSLLVVVGLFLNTCVLLFTILMSFARKFDLFLINLIINVLAKIKIVKKPDELKETWYKNVDRFQKSSSFLISDWPKFVRLVIASTISLILLYAVPILVLKSLGVTNEINFVFTIFTSAFVTLVGNCMPIPGGTGGLEYAFLTFFGTFIVNPVLTSLMLLWRFITYYLPMIFGALLFNFRKKV